jgi:hypothetical protein
MLGEEENRKFTSLPTEYGNYIEDKVFEFIGMKYPTVVSNPFYKSKLLSEQFGFDIFNQY